ncbi:roadblock/LC7 domain-containing protein [Methanocella sp. MCL-LM]|uniref:roadblock/LC7 domain-containing protein n=1 Tax=Methanocella sp. MCL-LM TaxID=3412035 RepID=UPI003C75A3D6
MMEGTMEDRSGKLGAVLRKLNESGIEASAVVSRDGFILQSELQAGEEEKAAFAAMAAAVLGAAETATSELKQGVPRRVIIEAGDHKLIEVGAGPVALLVAMVGPKMTLAEALKAIDKAALEIRSLVKPSR